MSSFAAIARTAFPIPRQTGTHVPQRGEPHLRTAGLLAVSAFWFVVAFVFSFLVLVLLFVSTISLFVRFGAGQIDATSIHREHREIVQHKTSR